MITVTTADSVLKTYYLDAVKEQLDMTVNPFLAEIAKSSIDMAGKGVEKAIRLGVSGGIGAGSEDGDLPVSDDGNFLSFTQDLKNLFGNFRISDKAVKASRNNDGAFVNLLNDEMQHLLRSATFNLDRMLFGDGSGKLCKITGVTSNHITVEDARNLSEGMIVDLYTSSTNKYMSGKRISFVDKVNKYFILAETAFTDNSLPKGAFITLQESFNKEICGLGTVFSDSDTIYGVERSKSSALTPYIVEDFGAVSEVKMMEVLDHLEETTGSRTNFIICSNDVRRALVNLFAANKRYVDTLDLKGGFKAISFNGIPIVTDRFCPAGTMYFLNTEDFCMYQLGDWDWIPGEDGKILKQVAGKPIYEATLVKYLNLMCFNPSAQAMVKGVTDGVAGA